MRIVLYCLAAVLAFSACNKNKKPTAPKVDPIKAEEQMLDKLRADHLKKITADTPEAGQSLVYLEIDALARFSIYQQANPEEAKAPLTPESIALRVEMGKYLSDLRKKKLHLTPIQTSSKAVGLTPLGAEINKIATNLFLVSSNPTTQPGKLQGNIDMLRLYYEGSRSLDVTRRKPAPAELVDIAILGIDVCDAILELYSATNFSQLTGLKQDKKLIAGFKRNISINRKQFLKAAGLKDTPKKDPKPDPKTDPKKDPKTGGKTGKEKTQ